MDQIYNLDTDLPAPAWFKMGYQPDGVGEDGLPLYREVLEFEFKRSSTTHLVRAATDEDIAEFRDAYALFQKRHTARKQADGYPLAMWPVASAADVENCAARDITTVQQLAALKGDRVPPAIRELAERARKMVELQAKTGKYEAIISGLEAERDQLAAELKEANATISAQNSMINNLKMRVA